MKHIALLTIGLLTPALAATAPPQGTRFGLGATVDSGSATLHVPIEVSPAIRVEPFFAWSESETTGPLASSSETRELGAGAFFRLDVRERLQAYVGGRLSYVEQESTGSDLDGFRIEPTVGAEFWITDRFSAALEAYLFRVELDGSSGGGPSESEASGSDTRFLVRMFPF